MTEKEFIKKWVTEIGGLLKNFPDDFVDKPQCEKMPMPGKSLVPGSELFGSYEILDTDGNPQLQVSDYSKLKFILYSNRSKPSEIYIPKDEAKIKSAVKSYEAHIDSFLLGIEKEYKNDFPGAKNFKEISNSIFYNLNIQRY
jgi:hypothetical protein